MTKNLEEFSLNELSFYIGFSLFIKLYQLNRKIRIFNLDNPDLTLAYLKDTSDIYSLWCNFPQKLKTTFVSR